MSQSRSDPTAELRVVERFIEDASDLDYRNAERFVEEAVDAGRAFEEVYTNNPSRSRFVIETGEKYLGAVARNAEKIWARDAPERQAIEKALEEAEVSTSPQGVLDAVNHATNALDRGSAPGDGGSPSITCATADSAVELERKLNEKLGDGDPEGISMLSDDGDFYGCVLLSEAVEDLHE